MKNCDSQFSFPFTLANPVCRYVQTWVKLTENELVSHVVTLSVNLVQLPS